MWTFYSFLTSSGRNVVEGWYESQGETVQATFIATLRLLRDLPPHHWRRPVTGKLTGDCDGLIEIRFFEDNIQWRPLGFYGPQRLEFTIVAVGVEKDDSLTPKDICRIALARKEVVLGDGRRIQEYEI